MTLTPQNFPLRVNPAQILARFPTTTYLLHKHDDLRTNHSPPVTTNREELADYVPFASFQLGLDLEKSMHVVQISSGLDFCPPETRKRLKGAFVASLQHLVTGRLGLKEWI